MAYSYEKLSSIAVGSVINIMENNEYNNYIVLKHGYATVSGKAQTLLLRKYVAEQGAFNNSSSGSYPGSVIDNWMNNFSDGYISGTNASFNISSYIPTVTVPCQSGNTSANYGRKVFALSATEVGFATSISDGTSVEGSSIPYFNSDSRRIAYKEGSSDECSWLLRSINSTDAHNLCWRVKETGKSGSDMLKPYSQYWYRPAFCLPGDLTIRVSTSGVTYVALPNTPPSAITNLTVPTSSVMSNTIINISWTAATDTESPASNITHVVQRSIDGGSTWATISTVNGTVTSTTDSIPYSAATSVYYRVAAYDSYGQYSDYVVSSAVSIINNVAPTAPGTIVVGTPVKGSTVTIGWGVSSDADNNLSGYKLERSTDSGATWTQIYAGASRSYTDTVNASWSTIMYRVRAYDSYTTYSAYTTSTEQTCITPVTITVELSEESEIVENETYLTDAQRVLAFRVTNSDDLQLENSYIGTLKIDDNVVAQINGTIAYVPVLASGLYTFTITKALWQTILNGSHAATLEITDGDGNNASKTITFSKDISSAVLQSDPIEIELETGEIIDKCLVNVSGEFPSGSELTVHVTNNANDITPAWQTLSAAEINSGNFISITNSTIANGNAFAIKVEASRGTATDPCYISSVNGVAGKNYFSLIAAQIVSLEGRITALE